MTEEERAAAYRQSRKNRIAFEKQMAIDVRGDEEVANQVRDGWQPVIDANREKYRDEPQDREYREIDRWTPA